MKEVNNMSIYIMSDIHGAYRKFLSILKKINFSDNDFLYILGDVIDRGKDSIPLLLDIMERENVIMLLGNHEYMMYQVYAKGYDKDNWITNGGGITDSQFSKLSEFDKECILDYFYHAPVIIPDLNVNNRTHYLAHSTFLDNPKYLKTKTIASLTEREINHVLWKREYPYCRIKESIIYEKIKDSILITGHTMTKSYFKKSRNNKGNIFFGHQGHFIGMDCGCAAYANNNSYGRLGCLRLDDKREFYM